MLPLYISTPNVKLCLLDVLMYLTVKSRWLFLHFTDPPDTDEKLHCLSAQSPQMKSYIMRFWRGCVSPTLKMTRTTTTHTHTLFLSVCCKSRPSFQSWHQFCLFLVILALIHPLSQRVGLLSHSLLLCQALPHCLLITPGLLCGSGLLYLTCWVALDATWSLQWTFRKYYASASVIWVEHPPRPVTGNPVKHEKMTADRALRKFLHTFNLWPTFSETENDAASLVCLFTQVRRRRETLKLANRMLHVVTSQIVILKK